MIWDVKMIWDNQCVSDDVDQILEQWRNTRTDIDPSPMELTGRLQRAAVFTREQLTSNFTAAGLEPGQFDVLATIYRAAGKAGALTAGELARWVMVSAGALTNRVDNLVAAGLVTRRHDTANRRRVLIALTDQGRHSVETALETHLENCRAVAERLDVEEVQQLNRLLAKMLPADPD